MKHPAKPSRSPRAHARPPGEIRIIGGLWRGSRVPVPDMPGLRPTPDRVRETLFNWLGQRLHGMRCLDLFAGTGALGLEAASRGAVEVVCVERHEKAARLLHDTAARLGATGLSVHTGEALLHLARLQAQGRRFDVVFLDPPFDSDLGQRVMASMHQLVAPGGWVYLESPRSLAPSDFGPHWQIHRTLKAGMVRAELMLRCDNPPEVETSSSDAGKIMP